MKARVVCLAVLVCLLSQAERLAYAQQPSVQAQGNSISAERDAIGNTINIGIPSEKLDELIREKTRDLQDLSSSQRRIISLLEEKLDLNQRQVRAALTILGEANVAPEQLSARLVEVAERFKTLQTTAAAQPSDDPNVAALKADAQKAIEAGDLAKADELLAVVETIQAAALDRLALNAAEISAQRGKVALTRLRYLEAAKHFATAASRVPGGYDEERLNYLVNYLVEEANALYLQGSEFGDNAAALSAIEQHRRISALYPREREPLGWAWTQTRLGDALMVLGNRESGTARLEEAVVAFRAALEERTREREPHGWAATQSGLGAALGLLGMRESGTARLEEAVAAYRAALQERTRERVPIDWAVSTGNEGEALIIVAERRKDVRIAEIAVNQIEAAYVLCRDSGHVPCATNSEAQLPKARALRDRLKGH